MYKRYLLTFLLSFICLGKIFAKIELSNVLGSNMVLQQNSTVKIWGKANAGQPINLKAGWSQKISSTITDHAGNWEIKLHTPKFGGPYQLNISSGKEQIDVSNVLIGDVWVCSGQSNMEMPLAGWGKINDYKKEIANANYPNIRLLSLAHVTSKTPVDNPKVLRGGWNVCSPASIPEFSSPAYFFAREIYQKTGIPIGLIQNTWSGVVAEAWVSGSSLRQLPDFINMVDSLETMSDVEATKVYGSKLQKWRQLLDAKDKGLENGKPQWIKDNSNVDWSDITMPGQIETVLTAFNGVFWLRKVIDIPSSWMGKPATLSMGEIDEEDVTWVNGVKVGETSRSRQTRKYELGKEVLKAGKNIIVIRVFDGAGDGGIYGNAKTISIINEKNEQIPLIGNWEYRIGIDLRDMPKVPAAPSSPNNPTLLYNAMVHPLLKYKIKGVVWYQGEGNSSRANQYQSLFPTLIEDWRKGWKQGSFPFYFTQLANFRTVDTVPGNSNWAELREAQLKTLQVDNTGMAVTIDIGDEKDLHPKNKQDVGKRLAYIALAKTYGLNVPYSGPILRTYEIIGNEMILTFDFDEGLRTSDNGHIKGFQIAGSDKKFYWAEARLDRNKIRISCPKVLQPTAVRYAWGDNPICNLTNSSGLPASPFRTDD